MMHEHTGKLDEKKFVLYAILVNNGGNSIFVYFKTKKKNKIIEKSFL